MMGVGSLQRSPNLDLRGPLRGQEGRGREGRDRWGEELGGIIFPLPPTHAAAT